MTHRFWGSLPVLAALISLSLSPVALLAQARSSAKAPVKAWTMPKTPGGDPDLEGTWTTTTTTPFERSPQFGDRLFMTDAEYAEAQRALERQRQADNQDTAPNANVGTGPPAHWTERAREASRPNVSGRGAGGWASACNGCGRSERDYDLAHNTDAFEHMSPWDRCITRGMPGGMFPGGYGNVYQIVQSPGVVAILSEMIHETRIIPLDSSPHLNIKQWNGDSIGRWDGNTLVVDTRNYNGKGWIATNVASGRIKGIPQSEALHVTERFTRVDASTIQYEISIEDPNVYTRPWKMTFPFYKDPDSQIFEYACHEGNYAMTHILSGARAEERAAAEAAKNQK